LSGASGPAVSVVIVGYNSRDDIAKCLSSIYEPAPKTQFETIVVDNSSSDGTGDLVRREFPDVRLFENRTNVGFSRAVNQGIREARGRYVLILNPDVTVLPGSLDSLAAFMDDHSDAAIVGAKLLNEDGTVQDSCRRFYTFWTLLLRRTFLGRVFRNSRALANYLMLDFDHEHSREVDWVIGACMMVRVAALSDIGLMDERFFLYFEDVDWCYRAWQRGWKVYYVAEAVMRHRYARESARVGFSRQLVVHIISLFHFYEKWGELIYRMKKYRSVLRRSILVVADLAAVNGSFALAYAIRSSLRGLLEKPMFGVSVYETFVVFANIVFLSSFTLFGLYDRRTERESGADLLFRTFRATVAAALILMASTFLTSQTIYSRVLVGAFSFLTVVLVTVLRLILRGLHRLVRAGRFDLTRIVVVGTGPTADRTASRILAHEELGYDLAGLVDTGSGSGRSGLPILGTLEELPRLIEDERIGEVVFADPELPDEAIADFLLKARRSAVDVKMVSSLTGLLTARARVEEFLDLPVVAFEREALLKASAGVKRLVDVVVGTLLLGAWAPFLAVTAFAMLLTTRRGPLASVPALGLHGHRFEMWTLRPTTRPSPLRRFVVRHGLSAFPQLINVVRGDMSLVGPAPMAPGDGGGLDAKARLRFDARPGVAGLASVSVVDSGAVDDRLALDAYYVQNWSLGGDVRIMLRWLGRCVAGKCSLNGEGSNAVRRSAD